MTAPADASPERANRRIGRAGPATRTLCRHRVVSIRYDLLLCAAVDEDRAAEVIP